MVEFFGFSLFGYVHGTFCLVSGLFKFFFGGFWAGLLGWYLYTFLPEEVKKDFFNFPSITNCNTIDDSGVMLFDSLPFYFLKVIYSLIIKSFT